MALVEISEMGTRDGGLKMEGLQRTYRRTYKVITSSAAVEPLEIMTQATSGGVRLPAIGESYVGANGYYDTGAIVDELSGEQPHDELPTYWIWTVIWRSFPSNLAQNTQGSGGGSPGQPQSSNPLFQPPKVTWGTRKKIKGLLTSTIRPDLLQITNATGTTYRTPEIEGDDQEAVAFAYDQNAFNHIPCPIANSAGSVFQPAPQKEISFRTLTITRNEPEFRPYTSDLYVGKVNSEIFQRQDPGCVICDDIDAEYGFQDGIAFFAVTYRFSIAPLRDNGTKNPFFWYQNLVNLGPFYREVAGGEIKEYKTGIGLTKKDAYLALDGTLLAGFDKNTGVLSAGAKPIVLIFPDRKSIDFGELELPDPAFL